MKVTLQAVQQAVNEYSRDYRKSHAVPMRVSAPYCLFPEKSGQSPLSFLASGLKLGHMAIKKASTWFTNARSRNTQ